MCESGLGEGVGWPESASNAGQPKVEDELVRLDAMAPGANGLAQAA
jgi:hypothetical protein